MQSTNEKGTIAEIAIELAATKLGVAVYKPVSQHSRADMLFEIGDGLWRVQCKWGRLNAAGDVVIVHLFTSSLSPQGYVRRTYTEQEIDLFAVYCEELDRSFLLPASRLAGVGQIHLRLTPLVMDSRHVLPLPMTLTSTGL